MREEAVVNSFEILSRYLPGGAKISHEIPPSGQLIFWPKFEPGISGIRSRGLPT
jgi:hypothetical protein